MGSSDRAGALADALAAADPRVRVHHQPNRGYGGALRAGFANARGELIAFSDGDLQFDLAEFKLLLDRLDDPSRPPVDAVIGWRIKHRDPFHRIFIAKTYNAIVSIAFGLRVRDIDCAMKLFRGEVFDGLRLTAESPFLSAELLIELRARGFRMAQVGVHHFHAPPGPTPEPASGRSCAPSATSAGCAWRSGSNGVRLWASRPVREPGRSSAERPALVVARQRRAPVKPGPVAFASVKWVRAGARRCHRTPIGRSSRRSRPGPHRR